MSRKGHFLIVRSLRNIIKVLRIFYIFMPKYTMNGMLNTKKHLDMNFTMEETQSSLKNLKIDIITQKSNTKHKNQFKQIAGYIHLNSVFLYYFLYLIVGATVISV